MAQRIANLPASLLPPAQASHGFDVRGKPRHVELEDGGGLLCGVNPNRMVRARAIRRASDTPSGANSASWSGEPAHRSVDAHRHRNAICTVRRSSSGSMAADNCVNTKASVVLARQRTTSTGRTRVIQPDAVFSAGNSNAILRG